MNIVSNSSGSRERLSINMFASGRRVYCFKNLSDFKDKIAESLCQDDFPIIGKSYVIKRCVATDRNMPFQLSFYEFETKEDLVGRQFTFNSSWFIPECVHYNIFLGCSLNIRGPDCKQKIQAIYENGLWKPFIRKAKTKHSLSSILSNIQSKHDTAARAAEIPDSQRNDEGMHGQIQTLFSDTDSADD